MSGGVRPELLPGTEWADRDSRESGRVVRVKSVTQNRVLVEVVANRPGREHTIGRSSLMSLRNLHRRYLSTQPNTERQGVDDG